MSRNIDNYSIDADSVIDDLCGQIGALTREAAVLRAVIASLEATVVELGNSKHSHDEQA